ncbi:hypothetical protein IJV57_05290 [Candidatus Saccharibacteria bacterium]|nr:hypothetical protein [Candidatus Saccharibacteria bacterium]
MKKKSIIITSSVVLLFLVITITTAAIIYVNKTQISQQAEDDQPFDTDYTDIQKVYYNFETEMQLDEIKQFAKEINEKIEVQTGEDWGKILLEDSREYIDFMPVSYDGNIYAEDIIYYDRSEGVTTYILKSDYSKYTHFNGVSATEFDTIEEAISDHIQYTKYRE